MLQDLWLCSSVSLSSQIFPESDSSSPLGWPHGNPAATCPCATPNIPPGEEDLRGVGNALWILFFMLFKLNLPQLDFSLALISFWNRTCETGRENATLGLPSDSAEVVGQKDGARTSVLTQSSQQPQKIGAVIILVLLQKTEETG